ncbi:MAG: FAD-binding oxidoreductase [Proteobacteria bacterium]|nr:FAD-binding oxidoreductase [Pseudomonadota bacterium]
MPSSPFHVAVLGAGVFGVSAAVHLQRLGALVTLVTEAKPANGASSRSLSWLNSARRRSDAYHRLRMAGIDRYRTLSAHLPSADWLRFDGGLTWDAGGADNTIAAIQAHESALGYDSRLVSADDVPALLPGVNPRAIPPEGAIFNPGEGWVDLPSLIHHLLAEFTVEGGSLITDAGPGEVLVRAGRAVGLRLEEAREIQADAVVLATGPAVPRMAKTLGLTIPDSTPISMLVKTRPQFSRLKAVLNTPHVAIRPTPDGGLVMDSAWSEEEIIRHLDGACEVRDSTIARLLAEASAVLDGAPDLRFESFGMGPKPIPGDGEPVAGALPGVPGGFVLFSHSGATLGLIMGELIAHEIVTGAPHPLLAAFRPDRFR